MAAKSLPIVGEAFLGSDPMVQKMVKVTFGSSGFSGTNNVDITTAGAQDLITFADSNFVITKIYMHVVEAFSNMGMLLGVDSDPDAIITSNAAVAGIGTNAGFFDLIYACSTAAGALYTGAATAHYGLVADGLWPADSDDHIEVSFSGQGTLGTEGHAALYVYYIRTDYVA